MLSSRNKSRIIVALTFVSICYIKDAFRAMENYVDVRLQPIVEWFGNNYMGKRIGDRPAPPAIDVRLRRRPLFAHEMWNVNKRVENNEDRTNNQAEGANHTLTVAFSVDHSTIWKFIDGLWLLQVGRDAKYELMVRGEAPPAKRRKYQNADTRIIGLIDKFNRGGDIIEFLHGIANNSVMEQ